MDQNAKMRVAVALFCTGVLLIAFNNCSEARFVSLDNTENSLTKGELEVDSLRDGANSADSSYIDDSQDPSHSPYGNVHPTNPNYDPNHPSDTTPDGHSNGENQNESSDASSRENDSSMDDSHEPTYGAGDNQFPDDSTASDEANQEDSNSATENNSNDTSSGANLDEQHSEDLSHHNSQNHGDHEQSDQVDLEEDLPSCESTSSSGPCWALQDSFENRKHILDHSFGWLSILDDSGRRGHKAGLSLNIEDNKGSVSAGEQAAYFSGRPGGSVHHLYLISKSLDLSSYNRLKISFDYLPIHLESWKWRHKTGHEELRLEVCTASKKLCGLNHRGKINKKRLNGKHWKTVFKSSKHEGRRINNHFHLRDILLSDWKLDNSVVIDLNQVDKAKFMFRFSVIIDEGIDKYRASRDGVGLDNIKALAYQ